MSDIDILPKHIREAEEWRGHPLSDDLTDARLRIAALERELADMTEQRDLHRHAADVSKDAFVEMGLRAQRAEAELAALNSHGPEGHNVTNLQYQQTVDELLAARAEVTALERVLESATNAYEPLTERAFRAGYQRGAYDMNAELYGRRERDPSAAWSRYQQERRP